MTFEIQTLFESQLQQNPVLFKNKNKWFKFFYTNYESIYFFYCITYLKMIVFQGRYMN